jgi:TetR/AcrR family transcriptional repressor of nem operon
MRYQKGHKEETKRHILEAASARFRRDGISAVGIKSLMGDVGLTHGGFYAHFPSKEGLVSEAIDEALAQTWGMLSREVGKAAKGEELKAFVHAYLGEFHRDHMAFGCAAAALAPEIARESREVRAAFTTGIGRIVDTLAQLLPGGGSPRRRRERAFTLFAAMMGTLQLARAVDDEELSGTILAGGRRIVLGMAGSAW